MLSKVQKYIDSISSTPHLEALQEACQLFEKEQEQWKQKRLELLIFWLMPKMDRQKFFGSVLKLLIYPKIMYSPHLLFNLR